MEDMGLVESRTGFKRSSKEWRLLHEPNQDCIGNQKDVDPTRTLPEPYQTGRVDLKPCPFCGSKNIDLEYVEEFDSYYATCTGCGVATRYTDREQAIRFWNRRAKV